MKSHFFTCLLFVLLAHSSISSLLFGQKLDGVYIGTFQKKQTGVVELKGSNDLITGMIQTGINRKWFFYGLVKGTVFDNHHLLDLGNSPYVKGEVKQDTLYLAVETQDSSYAGKFVRARKKKANDALNPFYPNSETRDMRLVGVWVCIDDSAPEKHRDIDWKMTFLKSGIYVPDFESAKRKYFKVAEEYGIRVTHYPINEIRATWYTDDSQITISYEGANIGVNEFTSFYELKNDTLRLTNIKNYTSVFVRVKEK